MSETTLREQIAMLRRRMLLVGSSSDLLWALFAGVLLWVAAMWLDLLWELSPAMRVGATLVAAVGGGVLLIVLIARTLNEARPDSVARRWDEAAGSRGAVLTGWELQDNVEHGHDEKPLSRALAQAAVAHAARICSHAKVQEAADTRPVRRAGVAVGTLLLALLIVVLVLPTLAWTEWSRFTRPWDDVPPHSRLQLTVEPGDVAVRYGESIDIFVSVSGGLVDRVELMLLDENQTPEPLPMFPDPDGRWRTTLAHVTVLGEYFVRTQGARSMKYKLDVLTVPQIEQIRLRLTPPAYTQRSVYEGPMPADGIVGLAGTRVKIIATSNRPLQGGTLEILGGQSPEVLACVPTAERASQVVGEFLIAHSGTFRLRVEDIAGQLSNDVYSARITQLPDERPFVRLLAPRTNSLATPDAALPVELLAEDDCGVSRLQLFRSLNGSRPLPMDLITDIQRPLTRVQERVYLPLYEYGLAPGDEIKLFGRVEDNDPAGAKGSESPVATVRIISQADFERLIRQREGLEHLISKYREAARRMETLKEKAKGLRKKLNKKADEPLSEEEQAELKELVEQYRREAAAMAALAERRMPYDLDKSMTEQLQRLTRTVEQASRQLQRLERHEKLSASDLHAELGQMLEQLEQSDLDYENNVMIPLEQLGRVYPLLEDQSRFVQIVQWQQDLAARMAALNGSDQKDDPALKVRMRDLEQEQREVSAALEAFLTDIESHVAQLPEDEQFDELRNTALEFLEKVGESGAAEAMSEAELALAEFSGPRAYQKAQEAAELLAALLEKCNSMGGEGQLCLKFSPGLGDGMGNTVEQLLAEMGLGTGPGASGQGGYSARRSTARNTGLYGASGSLSGNDAGQRRGENAAGGRGGASGSTDDSYADAHRLTPHTAAGGGGEAAVPLRYRQRVGQYFQRIAGEVPEQ